jgi:hypothetical protein
MSVQGYNNRKLKKQKRKKACAEFEQIRKTWSRNPGEGRLQADE